MTKRTTRAKIIGLRIQCSKQLPIRLIPRDNYAIGPMKGPRRYYVVRCDCGDVHRIRMRKTECVSGAIVVPKAKRSKKPNSREMWDALATVMANRPAQSARIVGIAGSGGKGKQ